jgi:hypothetical protein
MEVQTKKLSGRQSLRLRLFFPRRMPVLPDIIAASWCSSMRMSQMGSCLRRGSKVEFAINFMVLEEEDLERREQWQSSGRFPKGR